ncbi:MAG TPA: transglycosylase domain-containing protein [Streptosporangiaceae bacterium]|nr:transglycosylase domain-containing protein [Streptosporangiaceae bacterium]
MAQDLRERLGVRGGSRGDGTRAGGMDDPSGTGYTGGRRAARAAAGYGGERATRTLQRGRPGWGGPGDGTGMPGRRRPGYGGRGGAGGPGGPGGPGGRGGGSGPGGRRTFKEWLLYGSWWRHWTLKKAAAVFGGTIVGIVVLLGAGFFFVYSKTPIPTDTTAAASAAPSSVYYANGKLIGTFNTGGLNRQVLTTEQIPQVMDQAIIAAEDRHFFSEGGISITGIMRAAYTDIKGGSYSQGGSTLTEQFVKNYYAGFASANNSDKSATDKLKQMFVAIKLAHTKSKSWILTQYLNTVPFGENAYGVGAASQVYFGKKAANLTVSQAAMLAAMVNAPGFFSPIKGNDGYQPLVARWQYVLTNMVRDGDLTQAQVAKLKFPKVHLHFVDGWTGTKGYIMEMVEKELENTYGMTQSHLDNGGLKIYTTIKPVLMAGLVSAVEQNKQLMAQGGKGLPSYAHVGATLEQPGTGAILAVYGGPGWMSNQKRCNRVKCQYNMAEAPEPVGSSFKPYVLATAVRQNMNVQSSVLNGFSPLWIPPEYTDADRTKLSSRTKPADNYGYTHFNEPSENAGPIGVVEATAVSNDPAYMDLAHRVGDNSIMDMAKSLGIGQNPFNANGGNDYTGLQKLYGKGSDTAGSLQIALGGGPLTTVEQATTFATLAANGHYAQAHVVAKVVEGTQTLPSRVKQTQPLSATEAADIDYALSFDNTSKFPGATAYPNAAWDRQVIAKTGTLGNGDFASEAWFNGAIPQYSLSVALFTNKQTQNIDNLGGIAGGFGGTWPAKIWHTFMTTQFAGLPIVPLQTPDFTGYTPWNQVTGMMGVQPSPPPSSSPPPVQQPTPPTNTCPPNGHHKNCLPGGGFSSSPPPTSTSPAPTCTPSPGQQCSSPPTAQNTTTAVYSGPAADREYQQAQRAAMRQATVTVV